MDDTARIDAACGLVNAIGNRDWQGVAALLAENFRYIELGTGRTLDGPQAFIDAMSGWKGAFPGRARHADQRDGKRSDRGRGAGVGRHA